MTGKPNDKDIEPKKEDAENPSGEKKDPDFQIDLSLPANKLSGSENKDKGNGGAGKDNQIQEILGLGKVYVATPVDAPQNHSNKSNLDASGYRRHDGQHRGGYRDEAFKLEDGEKKKKNPAQSTHQFFPDLQSLDLGNCEFGNRFCGGADPDKGEKPAKKAQTFSITAAAPLASFADAEAPDGTPKKAKPEEKPKEDEASVAGRKSSENQERLKNQIVHPFVKLANLVVDGGKALWNKVTGGSDGGDANNDQLDESPEKGIAATRVAERTPRELTEQEQWTMLKKHDYAFLDNMPEEKRIAWLQKQKEQGRDVEQDYLKYKDLSKAGYYGQIDQMTPAEQRAWRDSAKKEQIEAYEKYHKAIENGDYSVFDKIGKVPADAPDFEAKRIKAEYKFVYDNLSAEQLKGLQQYNETRKAIERIQDNGDYSKLAKLEAPNKTLDLWLKTASPAERDAYAKAVLERQLSGTPEQAKDWFAKASPEQKKALFDNLQKRSEAEKDAWWAKVNLKETKDSPWSQAQKDYLADIVARDNGQKDGPLDPKSKDLQKIPPLEKLDPKKSIELGDYTKTKQEFDKLTPAERQAKLDEVLANPNLSEENRNALNSMSKEEAALAAFLSTKDGAGDKNMKDRLAAYDLFLTNDKSGYLNYVDKMDSDQLRQWLGNASSTQLQAYEKYMDAKAAGDYSFINKENYADFKANASPEDRERYKEFRAKVKAGDFSFLDRLHGDNKLNIYNPARFTDADYAKYQDYLLHRKAGDFSFVTKRGEEATRNWYKNATREERAEFEKYLEKLQSGNYSFVEDYLALKQDEYVKQKLEEQVSSQGPMSPEQKKAAEGTLRESWKKDQEAALRDAWIKDNDPNTYVEGKKIDVAADYTSYLKDLKAVREHADDFRKLDRMSASERQSWLENHADAREAYKTWQVKMAVGDFSFVQTLPTREREALLAKYKDSKDPLIKAEADAYEKYQKRIDAGDYSHIYLLDKANYDIWKAHASTEEKKAYRDFVDRINSGDLSFVEQYSPEMQKDWFDRLAKLDPNSNEKDGLEDFRNAAKDYRNDLADGYKTFKARTEAGDWSMIDKLSNKNWNDFQTNASPKQWEAYCAYKAAVKAGDYSFVDKMRDKNSNGSTPALDAWLLTASAENRKGYIDYHNKQAAANQIDEKGSVEDINNKIKTPYKNTELDKPKTPPAGGEPEKEGESKGPKKEGEPTPTHEGGGHNKEGSGSQQSGDKTGGGTGSSKEGSDTNPTEPTVPVEPPKPRTNQEIYDDFYKRLRDADKKPAEREELYKSLTPEEKKAIADYVTSEKSTKDQFIRYIANSSGERDLNTANFLRELQKENPKIKDLQKEAVDRTWQKPDKDKPASNPVEKPPTKDPLPPVTPGQGQTGTPGEKPPTGQIPQGQEPLPTTNPEKGLSKRASDIPNLEIPKGWGWKGDQPSQPGTKPGTDPVVKPGTDPVVKPGTDPVVKPGTDPVVKPGTDPVVKPGTSPLDPDAPQTSISNKDKPSRNPDTSVPVTDPDANYRGTPAPALPRPPQGGGGSGGPGGSGGDAGKDPKDPPKDPKDPPKDPKDPPKVETPTTIPAPGRRESEQLIRQQYQEEQARRERERQNQGQPEQRNPYNEAARQAEANKQLEAAKQAEMQKQAEAKQAEAKQADAAKQAEAAKHTDAGKDASKQANQIPGEKPPADGKGNQPGTSPDGKPNPDKQLPGDLSKTAPGADGKLPAEGKGEPGKTADGQHRGPDGKAIDADTKPGQQGSSSDKLGDKTAESKAGQIHDSAQQSNQGGKSPALDFTPGAKTEAGQRARDMASIDAATGLPLKAGDILPGKSISADGKSQSELGQKGNTTDGALFIKDGKTFDAAGRILDASGKPIDTRADASRSIDPSQFIRGPQEMPGSRSIDPATGKPVSVDAAGSKTGGISDIPGAVRIVGDAGGKPGEGGITKEGRIGIPEKGSGLGQGDAPSGKGVGQPGQLGGIITTGGVIPSKAETGKGADGAGTDITAGGKPGAKDPGIGLSQLGQGTGPTTPGQKPLADPQGAAGTGNVQVGPANLPTVQITGVDPKTGATIDPKTGATIDPKTGATVDPKTGATVDPKTGATVDPKTGATVDPKTGATVDPKTGATVDPKTGATVDPKTGATADPKTGATADPKTGATVDPKSGAVVDPKTGTTADLKTLDPKFGEQNTSKSNQDSQIAKLETAGRHQGIVEWNETPKPPAPNPAPAPAPAAQPEGSFGPRVSPNPPVPETPPAAPSANPFDGTPAPLPEPAPTPAPSPQGPAIPAPDPEPRRPDIEPGRPDRPDRQEAPTPEPRDPQQDRDREQHKPEPRAPQQDRDREQHKPEPRDPQDRDREQHKPEPRAPQQDRDREQHKPEPRDPQQDRDREPHKHEPRDPRDSEREVPKPEPRVPHETEREVPKLEPRDPKETPQGPNRPEPAPSPEPSPGRPEPPINPPVIPQGEIPPLQTIPPLAPAYSPEPTQSWQAPSHAVSHEEPRMDAPLLQPESPITPFAAAHSAEEQIAADLKFVQAFDQDQFQPPAPQHMPERLDVIEKTETQSSFAPLVQEFVAPLVQPQIEQQVRIDQPAEFATDNPPVQRTDEPINQAIKFITEASNPDFSPVQAQEIADSVIGYVAGNVSMNPIDVIPMSGIADEFTAADELSELGDKIAEQLSEFQPVEQIGQLDPEAILQSARDYDESLRARHQKELEDEKDRREQDDKYREEEAKRYAAAMLAALKARQAQEEANRVKAQKDPLSLENRQRYIVMAGDTLELIAQKRLFNKRLALLIYEINKSRIPVKMKDGKRLLQLKPRLVLLLPTQMEIKKFQTRLFGATEEKFEYDYDYDKRNTNPGLIVSASQLSSGAETEEIAEALSPEELAAAEKRRANVESALGKLPEIVEEDEGRIKYVARLGDSLRSISMRHPALKDFSLWKLVAELNDLSSQTDASGNPLAELMRGSVLLLPLPHEIAEFRENQRQQNLPAADANKKKCPSCNRLCRINTPICASCSYVFDFTPPSAPASGPKKYAANEEEPELPSVDTSDDSQYITHSRIFVGARDYLAQGRNSKPFNPQSSEAKQEQISQPPVESTYPAKSEQLPREQQQQQQQRNQIHTLADDCRIVSYGGSENSEGGFRSRLEYKQNEFWLPVVLYEVDDDAAMRHEYNLDGSRQSKRMELAAAQSRQLARNDLKKNWQQYVKRFLESKVQN